MLISIIQAVAGLILLYLGGEWLVRGASALAARVGISPLAIGLTIVALGTSAPELVVSLDAALSGANDISVGNVVGSNIANVGLILGLAALVRPCHAGAKVIRIDAPIMVVISAVLVGILLSGTATRIEGLLLVLALIAYMAFTLWEARRETGLATETAAGVTPAGRLTTSASLGLVAAGLAVLVGGGHILVVSAVALATSFGISQATIGLTVVAIGTSLPELATTVTASLRGESDIAVGNIIGSNVFNILGILGITALVQPLQTGAMSWLDLGTMFGFAGLLALLVLSGRRVGRLEGCLLLSLYLGYTAWRVLG